MSRPRSWTDDDLRRAVAVASSWKGVTRALGLFPGTRAILATRTRGRELGLDTSHFLPRGRAPPRPEPVVVQGTPAERRARARAASRRWSDDELRAAVAASMSWAGVHRALGLVVGGTTYRRLQERAAALGLDSSHFRGQGWSRGVPRAGPASGRPLAEILVGDSTYTNTDELRRRLLREGRKEARCEQCGRREWNGLPIPLQLDHVNGVRSDNRLENLRILCPNCHAQTDTWCGRNIGRNSPSWRNG
jgi:hypothetical protein